MKLNVLIDINENLRDYINRLNEFVTMMRNFAIDQGLYRGTCRYELDNIPLHVSDISGRLHHLEELGQSEEFIIRQIDLRKTKSRQLENLILHVIQAIGHARFEDTDEEKMKTVITTYVHWLNEYTHLLEMYDELREFKLISLR